MKHNDFIIIGAGIIGLTVAWELVQRGHKKILILDKEKGLGVHASGRNSGVIHAGIYYGRDSLKHRFCQKGGQALIEFAREHQLPIDMNGKVIVAKNEIELGRLRDLYQNALENGCEVEWVDEKGLREIEPAARTFSHAIFSPQTGLIDPKALLGRLAEMLRSRGVRFEFAGSGEIPSEYSHLFNCAGSYADQLARKMGVGLQYRALPFAGRYREFIGPRVRRSIYPVPDPGVPFLGIHVTPSLSGRVTLGPTAMPTPSRAVDGEFDAGVFAVAPLFAKMLLANKQGLGRLAVLESARRFKWKVYDEVREMLQECRPKMIGPVVKSGVRSQLIDIEKKELVMDFVVESGSDSTHVLNAVSPGFTASFEFAKYIVDCGLKSV